MTVAVIILNWNGKTLLEQFLPSVIKHTKGVAKVYLADNASTDGSVDFVKINFPKVSCIINTKNKGFSRGYNEALKNIKEDVLCLLNNDVKITKNWINPIINGFKSNPKTAIIQPKIIDYHNKSYFEYAGAAGGFIDKYGFPFCRGRIFNTLEKDIGQYDDNSTIFWASGACFFIRNSVFKTLQGFDESFFAHMEEIDLCWRAYNLGFKTQYVGASTVYHVGGSTLNMNHPKKTYLNFRNSLYTLTKNSPYHLLTLLPVRFLLDGVAGVWFLLQLKPRHTLAIIKAHCSFYGNFKDLLIKRNSLTKKKKYAYKTSIVWLYYVNKKKQFGRL